MKNTKTCIPMVVAKLYLLPKIKPKILSAEQYDNNQKQN